MIGVQEGQEPLVFRARFEAWDDGGPGGGTKVFQDVYEQRVVQMSVSGQGCRKGRGGVVTVPGGGI